MLTAKRARGRPAFQHRWTDEIEMLLRTHAKLADIGRYRLKCDGYNNGDIAIIEAISSETVKGSICRCKAIILHGKVPKPKIRTKKVVIANKCELCQDGQSIVWTEEHEKVCGRCYFILRRVRDEIEIRDMSDAVVDDVFLRVLEIA